MDLRDIELGMTAKLRDLLNQSKSIAGRASAEGRELTSSETSRIEAIHKEFDEYEKERDLVVAELAETKQEIVDRTPQRRLTEPAPVAHAGPGYSPSPQGELAAYSGSPLFNRMFPQTGRARRSQFANLGEFARAVYERNPSLFNAASGMGEGVGGDGGFFVPVQHYAGLMDASLQQEVVRPDAMIVPMTSSSLSIPMFDLSNRSTGIATLEGKVTGEGVTASTQKAKSREITLSARKVSILVPTSMELLQDAPQLFGQLLNNAMLEALGQSLDSWFLSGSGAGVPLGILNAPCLVSVAKDASQIAATITPTNIANMVARLAPGSWQRAKWIVSPSALAQLFTLATVTKNVAGTENVSGHAPEFFTVLPNGEFSLLGRPLVVSDRCQALGTKGDILLTDLKNYLIGIRQNAELLVDSSIGFKESEIWFRLNCRIDGQPALAAPITPRVGSATLSPFVALDNRG